MIVTVKALFFDVFGTLIDWRNGIARKSEKVLAKHGYKLDWLAFADAWRNEYQPGMEEVRAGRIPFRVWTFCIVTISIGFCRDLISRRTNKRSPISISPGIGLMRGRTCRPDLRGSRKSFGLRRFPTAIFR